MLPEKAFFLRASFSLSPVPPRTFSRVSFVRKVWRDVRTVEGPRIIRTISFRVARRRRVSASRPRHFRPIHFLRTNFLRTNFLRMIRLCFHRLLWHQLKERIRYWKFFFLRREPKNCRFRLGAPEIVNPDFKTNSTCFFFL